MIKAFLTGIRQANGSWKMVLLLLAANIIFSLPLVIPIFLLILRTAGGSLTAQKLYGDNVSAVWFSDLLNDQFVDESLPMAGSQIVSMLVVMGIVYLIVNTLLAGGIIEVFASDDRRFTMRKFWAGCGAYFWRFFRLMLVSIVFYGIAIGAYALLTLSIDKSDSKSTVERTTAFKEMAAVALLLLLISLVNMIFDYARIGAVINERRGMIRETFKAVRFSFRKFVQAFGLYVLIGVTGLIIFGVLFWLRNTVHQTSLAAIVLAAVIGQIAIASRMWTRLAYYAAQVNLYQASVPATALAAVKAEPPGVESTQPPQSGPADSASDAKPGAPENPN